MTVFKINGKIADQKSWNQLQELLKDWPGKSDQIFEDNEVTFSEIYNLLDIDQDGTFDPYDLIDFSPKSFAKLDDYLKKYGFHAGREAGKKLGTYFNEPLIPKHFWSNKDFIIEIVKKHPGNFFLADLSLRRDRATVLAVVKRNGMALEFADEPFKSDPEIVLTAIGENAESFRFADESLQKDPEFALSAVRLKGYALKYIHESLRGNPEIVLAAVEQNGLALEFANKSLKSDPKIVLAAIIEHVDSFEFADESLPRNREFVLAAVKEKGYALDYADESLQKDPEIVLAAINKFARSFKFADETLRNDIEFLKKAAAQNIAILELIDPQYTQEVWDTVVGRLRELNKELALGIPESELTSYQAFKTFLIREYDIHFVARFQSIDTICHIINTRNNPVDPDNLKPIAIITAPKTDYNHAFEVYPVADRLIELGYRVIYYEAYSEREAEQVLSEATDDGRVKADLIVLAGHGTSKDLQLGQTFFDNEQYYIGTDDFGDLNNTDINLRRYIKPDGDIILYSCSNGEGKDDNPNNLANTIYSALPELVSIHSADQPINMRDISIDSRGKLTVEWLTKGSLYKPGGKIIANK